MGKILKIIGGLVLLGVLGICAVAGFGAFAVGKAADDQQKQSATAVANPSALNEDVMVGDVRWKVLEAKDVGSTLKSDNQFIKDLSTPGRFVQVRFEIENKGKEMKSFGGLDLVDSQTREYKSSSDAISFIPEDEQCIIIENLNPNVPKVCTTIYAVPSDAAGLKAKIGDLNPISNKFAYISLTK